MNPDKTTSLQKGGCVKTPSFLLSVLPINFYT